MEAGGLSLVSEEGEAGFLLAPVALGQRGCGNADPGACPTWFPISRSGLGALESIF